MTGGGMDDSKDIPSDGRLAAVSRRRLSLMAGAAAMFVFAFGTAGLGLAASALRPRPGVFPGLLALLVGAVLLAIAARLRRGAAPWFVPTAPGAARPRFRAFPVTLLLWAAGLAGILCAFLALGSPIRPR